MSAVWMRARSDLRGSWRSTVVLAVLIGLVGGVTLAAAAGARRTETAYPRFLVATNSEDYLVSAANTGTGFYTDVSRLPEVAQTGVVDGLPFFYSQRPGRLEPSVQIVASRDGKAGYDIEKLHMLSGRPPRRDRASEIAVTHSFEQRYHVGTGGRISLVQVSAANGRPVLGLDGKPVTDTFTVTGVEVSFDEVIPIAPNDAQPQIFATPALARQFPARGELDYDGTLVKLRSGADPAAFRRDIQRLAQQHKETTQGIFVADEIDHHARVEHAIKPEALALWIFALLAGVAGLLAIGQILSRRIFLDAIDYPTLRSLGMSEGDLVAVGLARALLVGLGGGVLAMAAAFLASPIMPIGPARIAEPNRGFEFNVAILGAGFALIVLSVSAIAIVAAWRAARAEATASGTVEVRGAGHPSRLAGTARRAGLSPSVVSGIRFALEAGRGRTAVPVRTAMLGVVVAIAAVTGSFTFGTNLSRLVGTPSQYGKTWNLDLDTGFGGMPRAGIDAVFGKDRDVAAYAGGVYGEATIDGRQVPAVGLDSLGGTVAPTIIHGRGPADHREIVLGGKTLDAIGAAVGDTVQVTLAGKRHPMRVVGQAVFPALGQGSFNPTGLGEGALTVASSIPSPYYPPGTYSFVVARFGAGVDPATATNRIREAVRASGLCPTDQECLFRTIQLPAELKTYADVKTVPLILALLLIAMGIAVTAHTLVTSVQRRRRDLATLKTLGFVRRQVLATVASQASVFAVVGLAVGLPAGIAAGRWAWSAFADQLGVPPSPSVPVVIVALAVPAALVLANLVAALPGRAAANTRPALVLRTE